MENWWNWTKSVGTKIEKIYYVDSSYILTFRLVDQKVVVEHLKKIQRDSCGGSKVQVAVGVVPMEKNVLV